MNIWKLAWRNIKYRRFHYTILFLLLLVVGAGRLATSFLVKGMNKGMQITKERLGADVMIVPSGFVTSIDDALFKGKPCTVQFEKKWADKIAEVEGVESVSAELYLATLSEAECCEGGLQLIAFDLESDFVVTPWVAECGISSLDKDEIIVGSSVNVKRGETIKFFHKEFKVAAVLDETGMGYDSSAFISFEAVKDIISDERNDGMLDVGDDTISAVCVKAEEGYDPMKLKSEIEKRYASEDISVYAASSKLSEIAENMQQFELFGEILNVLQLIESSISVFALATISSYQRKKEVASMELVGIPKSKAICVFLIEYADITVVAFTGTVLLAGIGLFPLHNLWKQILLVPYVPITVSEFLGLGIKTLFMMVVLILFATGYSFYRLWRNGSGEENKN